MTGESASASARAGRAARAWRGSSGPSSSSAARRSRCATHRIPWCIFEVAVVRAARSDLDPGVEGPAGAHRRLERRLAELESGSTASSGGGSAAAGWHRPSRLPRARSRRWAPTAARGRAPRRIRLPLLRRDRTCPRAPRLLEAREAPEAPPEPASPRIPAEPGPCVRRCGHRGGGARRRGPSACFPQLQALGPPASSPTPRRASTERCCASPSPRAVPQEVQRPRRERRRAALRALRRRRRRRARGRARWPRTHRWPQLRGRLPPSRAAGGRGDRGDR